MAEIEPFGVPAVPIQQVQRVQRASDQVAMQLRDMIVSGAVADGARLPTEHELARRTGVSRATIREALQVLAAEGLTRTRKGANGGTFVALPSPDDITDTLRFGVTLLSNSNGIEIENLLETSELLEVPAAGLAALRRTDEELAELRATLPGADEDPSFGHQLRQTTSFHRIVLRAAHNPVLTMVAQPLHHVLVARLQPAILGPEFQGQIHQQHADIADAIERQDAAETQRLMQEHLAYLRPRHERFWRQGASADR